METAYTVQEINNEVIFAKDKEIISEPKDELICKVMKSMSYPMDDAEFYVMWLMNGYNLANIQEAYARLFKKVMEVKHEKQIRFARYARFPGYTRDSN
jgi:hypothetical protein